LIVVTVYPTVFDRHIPALREAGFVEALPEGVDRDAYASGDVLLRKPITGIAFCCARMVRAAVIAPPSKRRNSRRLIQ
jgi:hypothetical protein